MWNWQEVETHTPSSDVPITQIGFLTGSCTSRQGFVARVRKEPGEGSGGVGSLGPWKGQEQPLVGMGENTH